MGMGEQNLLGGCRVGVFWQLQNWAGRVTSLPAHDISVSLLVDFPGEPAAVALGRDGRPDLGPALAGLGGDFWMVGPAYQVAQSDGG